MTMSVVFRVVLLAGLCMTAAGRPQRGNVKNRSNNNDVTVVKSEVLPLDVSSGSSSYDIELSDGTKLKQAAHTERPPQGETGSPSIVIEGSYSYIAPDGREISITYIADKNGFKPKGDVIPTDGKSSLGSSSSPSSTPAPAPPQSSPAIDVRSGSDTATVAKTIEDDPHEAIQVNDAESSSHQATNDKIAPAPQPTLDDVPVFERK